MNDFRIGNGYDVHALAPGLPLWLGGVPVPHDRGAVAHSDGDVAIHALCDALLGAAGLRDIGFHFPDTDPRYRGIDSKALLRCTIALIAERGYAVRNVDVTICLQQPKIGGLIPTMQEALAAAMGIEGDRVNVKATTTERLGFVGRQEGVAAYAVALIYREG